jgi:hypothetical protein
LKTVDEALALALEQDTSHEVASRKDIAGGAASGAGMSAKG